MQYSSFIGQSAPRFYYNVNPQQPDAAYAQLVVMNRDARRTPVMVAELGALLAGAVPEAMVVVKELQQGNIMEAPVEVRISGDSIDELKGLGDEVRAILSAEPEALYVHRDWYNDTFMVDLNIDNELANRLGLTNASVARTLAGAFDGLPVSVFWEGDRPITIVLRLDEDERASFASVGDTYVTSPVTHASVPVRAIGSLSPGWESGRIVRRNGVADHHGARVHQTRLLRLGAFRKSTARDRCHRASRRLPDRLWRREAEPGRDFPGNAQGPGDQFAGYLHRAFAAIQEPFRPAGRHGLHLPDGARRAWSGSS